MTERKACGEPERKRTKFTKWKSVLQPKPFDKHKCQYIYILQYVKEFEKILYNIIYICPFVSACPSSELARKLANSIETKNEWDSPSMLPGC